MSADLDADHPDAWAPGLRWALKTLSTKTVGPDLAGLLELVEPLARLVPPARQVEKPANSAFSRPGFASALKRRGISTLVVTGGETDVCVLATVMQAIDLGFRVVLPTDALCSTSDGAHDTVVDLFGARFSSQVEALTTEDLLRRWQ